ncbi:MAG: DEAD/DEAH box helicase, partial [Thermoanaerobaculia bacterium]|nr:DEAD/DEAH box helicase [Thermoanaerobaculia bacterium]
FQLPVHLVDDVLPHLCANGILGCWDGRSAGDPLPLRWDTGPEWELALRVELAGGGTARLTGALSREGESVPLSAPMLILPQPTTSEDSKSEGSEDAVSENSRSEGAESQGSRPRGWVIFPDGISRFSGGPEVLPWVQLLEKHGEIAFPKDEFEDGLTTLLEMPSLPRLEAPDELQLIPAPSDPQPHLVLEQESSPAWTNPPLIANLLFDYGEVQVSLADSRAAIVDWPARRFLKRDLDAEHKFLMRLLELGVRPMQLANGHQLEVDPLNLPAVAEPLLNEGWTVEAHGRSLRPPNPPAFRVQTGIDWFEVSGDVDFAGDRIDLSKLLSSISKGDRFVDLGDGSRGLLPEAWMETYESLAKLAQSSSDDGLRFLPSQALLVDTLLTAMPPANVDKAFSEMREKLRSFESIKPKKESRAFQGELRSYQRQGLGWLEFLREFGLGGVLADDMGLGKTVQVLALIQANRTAGKTTKLPFLVVSPRSLVYNWIDEASRFTPKLQVVEYSGPERDELHGNFNKYDIIVTTYGTLRRDVGYLATVEFDTVILDEAQAIKNPTSQSAKAASLLVARNRLALTGTPIENHLGELGSLFEFLNPGLLGRLPRLDVLASGRAASQSELAVVSEGIRPFILRRTKAQVLPDLPPKTEQVLLCTLRPEQRELYNQLLAQYQANLLHKGKGSQMQVLEALLRLRQVACHPGLVDDAWADAGSAKFEALFEQVFEVLEEGHKVIIFSQFTKLLSFVEAELEKEGTEYAYLDGKTKNRGDVVERFQTDPNCNLFLISLKAGGVGLNLTAAEYVFLLDPWWNPAVEAQAIDRAHRIGQTQPVFAYRLIAQDTVEEKILELQKSKRQLAEAVLEGDMQPSGDLTADDLRALLV